jgi:hypothetical protein
MSYGRFDLAVARSIILDGRHFERGMDPLMKFRLTYAGPLLSGEPLDSSGRSGRIAHEHRIRRHFHKQLREYWARCRFLRTYQEASPPMFSVPSDGAATVWTHGSYKRRPLPEVLGRVFGHSGYNFLPLVCKENSVSCSLRILCLHREAKNATSPVRNTDNRIKTVIDALAMPPPKQGLPLEDGKLFGPQEGEDPFFVLLDDRRRITHLEVETDTALEPDERNLTDECFVRLVISVEIRPRAAAAIGASFG